MLNLVIFGAPGSGKGTQSDKLIEKYNLKHISTGEVLRDHIARGTDLGVLADSYISKGQLVPDDVIIKVLEDLIDSDPDGARNGIILDGFPRTIEQAKALKKLLERRNTKIHAVIGLEVDEDELIRRMLKRGEATGRADDNLDTITKRLKVYHKQTQPLRDYYINEGKYHSINGNGSIDDIFSSIDKSLGERLPELKLA